MENPLAQLIRRAIANQGITQSEFVCKMGYRNREKGHRRLAAWLRGKAVPTGDQLARIARAADLPFDDVFKLFTADDTARKKACLAKRALDSNFYLTIRMGVCVYPRYTLGYDMTEVQAIEIVREKAQSVKRLCCLSTPSGKDYWFDGEGTNYAVTEVGGPTMRVGRKNIVFKASFGAP